jgi:nucleotide-binding universal stress UspA family protein
MPAAIPPVACATDFSPRAGAAATVAASLALRRGVPLRLVHALPKRGSGLTGPAREKLEAEAARLRVSGAVVETVLLRESPPARALRRYFASLSPSLIVVASAPKSFVDRWAFGSVADEIAQHATGPTLVLHAAEPFRTWDWSGDRLRVLVAADRFTSSDAAVRWVRELRRSGPCDLTVCHVHWQASTDGEPATASHPELTRLERDLRKKVRDLLGDEGGEVIVRATSGTPEATVLEIAQEVRADLIVVGTHQRHGLSRLLHGSLSRSLLHQPGCNVVTVPATAVLDPREAHIPDYRRVLVATDFSALGDAAVPHACAAAAVGARVRLVHVMAPSGGTRRAPALRARLRGLVPAELADRGQTAEVEVLRDRDAARAICAEAERFGADLVCLASHGLGGARGVFGSVSGGVLRRLRRPFLVVRRPGE